MAQTTWYHLLSRITNSVKELGLRLSGLFLWCAQSDSRLTVVLFLIIVGANLLIYPSLGIRAEPWAETATNYLNFGLTDDFFANMARTDAGYLVLFPRLFAYLLTRADWTIYYFPFLVQAIAHVSIGIWAALSAHRGLNPFVASTRYRVFLALLIGLYPDYELHSYVNFVYFAFPLLLLSVFWDLRRFSLLGQAIILLVFPLLFSSKGLFIIFLPVLAIRLAFDIRLRRGTANYCYGMFSLAVLTWQLSVMLANSESSAALRLADFKVFFTEWLPYYVHLASGLFVRKPPVAIAFLLSVAVLSWMGLRLKFIFLSEGIYSRNIAFVALLIFLGTGMLFINFLASFKADYVARVSVHFWDVGRPELGRQYFGINLTVILLLLFFLGYSGPKLQKFFPLFALLFLLRCDYFRMIRREIYPAAEKSFSSWTYFRTRIRDPKAFIPVNPYPWHLVREGKVLVINVPKTKVGNYLVQWTGNAGTMVVTSDGGCRAIDFADFEGRTVSIDELARPTGAHSPVRQHRLFDMTRLPNNLQSLQISCRDGKGPDKLEIMLHILP